MKLVVFGGILGDHPPKDRAKEFRSNFKQIRHLGKVQMTTDTAVLVSSEILELKRPFSSLKFIDNPEVPIDTNIMQTLDTLHSVDTFTASDLNIQMIPTDELLSKF